MEVMELFKELGYELVRNDDDYIIYSKPVSPDGVKKEVLFSSQLEVVQVYFEDDIRNTQTPSIDMSLFKTIQRQLKELKWLVD